MLQVINASPSLRSSAVYYKIETHLHILCARTVHWELGLRTLTRNCNTTAPPAALIDTLSCLQQNDLFGSSLFPPLTLPPCLQYLISKLSVVFGLFQLSVSHLAANAELKAFVSGLCIIVIFQLQAIPGIIPLSFRIIHTTLLELFRAYMSFLWNVLSSLHIQQNLKSTRSRNSSQKQK